MKKQLVILFIECIITLGISNAAMAGEKMNMNCNRQDTEVLLLTSELYDDNNTPEFLQGKWLKNGGRPYVEIVTFTESECNWVDGDGNTGSVKINRIVDTAYGYFLEIGEAGDERGGYRWDRQHPDDLYRVSTWDPYDNQTYSGSSSLMKNTEEQIQAAIDAYQSFKNSSDTSEKIYDSHTDSDYIIPNSDSVYLTRDELHSYSTSQLRYARNEIYARKGRKFNDQELQNYFNGKSWYTPIYDPEIFDENKLLNPYELKNAYTILEEEKSRK